MDSKSIQERFFNLVRCKRTIDFTVREQDWVDIQESNRQNEKARQLPGYTSGINKKG